jgi:hypothetical protein
LNEIKDRVEQLGEETHALLCEMVRELLARKSGSHLVEATLATLDLQLPLALKGADADPANFSRQLTDSINEFIDAAVQHAAVFRPGHAYCHRCEGGMCEHSQPPSSRHVFTGYAQTGTPRWLDLAQFCLERKHPEVDRLYNDTPAFVTIVSGSDELHRGMLGVFRQGSYELLGQVIGGFFTVPTRLEEGRGVLALTVQAAASRSRNGGHRYGLNILGRSPSGDGLEMLWERQKELPWRKAVGWAQSALNSLPGRVSRTRSGSRGISRQELDRRVDGIMHSLARRLERDSRARLRRTGHAEQRHASGERPTRKAIDDARSVGIEALMCDEHSNTLVVLGDRGRTHFFTPDGKHVSSVHYKKDAIARKITKDLWRQATAEELAGLQMHLPE